MKSRGGREIALLTLPVLLIGGVAWMRAANHLPKLEISNPFDPGPLRLEYASFSPLEVSGREAKNGFDWAAKTFVHSKGKWADMPKGWSQGLSFMPVASNLHIAYRQGQVWKRLSTAPSKVNPSSHSQSLGISYGEGLTFTANLERVPRDADEVRLRGHFEQMVTFKGAIPAGWKVPPHFRIAGPNRLLTVTSKPFNVLIKDENQPWPQATVSHAPSLKVVDAKWLTDPSKVPADGFSDLIVLQLRPTEAYDWKSNPIFWSQNLRLFDADNKEVFLMDNWVKKASTRRVSIQPSNDSLVKFSPDRPTNDLFVIVASAVNTPQGGWAGTKAPLRLIGEIGSGDAWPQPIDVKMEHLWMKPEDFGAAK